jgi:hypothetical protein
VQYLCGCVESKILKILAMSAENRWQLVNLMDEFFVVVVHCESVFWDIGGDDS